jgi:phenylalanyl-tRNA synthetase alpha chain
MEILPLHSIQKIMSLNVFDNLTALKEEISSWKPTDSEALEIFRIRFIGTKNILKPLMGEIRNVPNERKKEFGQLLNEVKDLAETVFQSQKEIFDASNASGNSLHLDLTAPGEPVDIGSRHPVSITMNRIIKIFDRMGFVVAEEREIEDDWHNFSAMNTPADHPARDMQDTYYLRDNSNMLLRTHTSSVQARIIEYIETKLFLHGPIASFTRLKDYILIKRYHLPI